MLELKINWKLVETVFKYTFLTALAIVSGMLIVEAFTNSNIIFQLGR